MSAAIVSTRFSTPARTRPDEAATAPATRLRLTRRGRVVFTALAALPLIAWAVVAVLGSGGAAADAGLQGPASFEYVTIGQGDSLWALAESIAPDGDPRVLVDEIIRLNGLDDAVVEPGQRLALPVVP